MKVTAYDPSEKSCGRYALIPMHRRKIASLMRLKLLIDAHVPFAAGPPDIPFGTVIEIPGYASGGPVAVLDRGGKIKGDCIDVFFTTRAEALEWGVQYLAVKIYRIGSKAK